jgi:hypothetical protein
MEYIFLFIQFALVVWLALNLYFFVIAYREWRNDPDPNNSFINFLLERIGVVGNTFVHAFVYTVLTIGAAYIIYQFFGMLFD